MKRIQNWVFMGLALALSACGGVEQDLALEEASAGQSAPQEVAEQSQALTVQPLWGVYQYHKMYMWTVQEGTTTKYYYDQDYLYSLDTVEGPAWGYYTNNPYPFFFTFRNSVTGLAPIWRCKLPTNVGLGYMRFLTRSSTCEGAAGAVNEGMLGYVATTQAAGQGACGYRYLRRLDRYFCYDYNGYHVYRLDTGNNKPCYNGTYEGPVGWVCSDN